MKTLRFIMAVAVAVGLATASLADGTDAIVSLNGSINFDEMSVDDPIPGTTAGFYYYGDAADNESVIVAPGYGGEGKALQVSTDTNALLRAITGSNESSVDLSTVKSLDIDTWVQFTLTRAGDDVADDGGNDKLKIYLQESAGATNLMVTASAYTIGEGDTKTFTPTTVVASGVDVVPGVWCNLKVVAQKDNDGVVFFNIFIGNTQLAAETSLYPGDTDKYKFPSLLGDSDTSITYLGFAGEGVVDELAFSKAVTGVASVDGVAYASFEDAAAAVAAGSTTDDFVTLLANVETTVSAGDTLKVKKGAYTFTVNKSAADVVLGETTDGNGITTYTAVEGVASVYDHNTSTETWYASFAEAYSAAALITSGDYPILKVKVSGDFTPSISANQYFSQIVFVNTSEGAVTINLKGSDGVHYMHALTYDFPANATLVLPSDANNSVSQVVGGTLNVPAGVNLTIRDYTALNGISGLTGSGTIKNGFTYAYYFVGNPDNQLPTLLRNSAWCGTLELSGTSGKAVDSGMSDMWDMEIARFANANSKVRFNGFTTRLYSSGHGSVAVELVGDGLTVLEETAGGRTYDIGGTLTGSGSIAVTGGGSALTVLKFTGDASAFAGNISFGSGANAAIAFGTTGFDSNDVQARRIVTGDDAVVTVAEGKTWTADDFILHGNVTVSGQLLDMNGATADAVGQVWNNHGTAVLTVKAAAACALGNSSSWRGKYVVGWDPGNVRFVINNYGNESSTVEIAGTNGVFSAMPSTAASGGTAPSINPTVILTANWTVYDGWTDATTTFTKLSGSGNLTVNGNGSGNTIPYVITTLDNYTGTLGGNRGGFTIGNVAVSGTPDEGARIVATAIGTSGSIGGALKLYVSGVETAELEYRAEGANGEGLYVKSSGGADWVDDVTTVTNKTVAEAYPALASTALATANAGELTEWAKDNNIAFSGVADAIAAAPTLYTEAFLLNCDPTAAAVAQEKEEFVLDISVAADGTATVTPPVTKDYNGTLTIKGSTTVNGTYAPGTAGAKFFKAELTL